MPIKVLSEQLASQIAAGEVVERPASAVKELVENAIDAGATTINVDVREGGRELIQIADNGSGIPAAQVETAFLRHATSKLDSAETLAAIQTLGFRGEALAAISSVSKVIIVTRTKDAKAGTRLELEGSVVTASDQVGAPVGTVIAIENLFFNTPARLKFLKSITSERRAIDEFITRYSLAYPGIRFRLTHNGRTTFQSSGNGNLQDALISVYGVEIGKQFVPVTSDEYAEDDVAGGEESQLATRNSQPITVSGFVSQPGLHRSNRSHISLFVNGRWIKDQRLTYAVIEAYHTLLPVGRFPLAALFIDMPFTDVDVNVHPMKTEVRFEKPRKVFGAVQKAVRETVLATAPVRSTPSPFEQVTGGLWQMPSFRQPADHTQANLDLRPGDPLPPIQSGAEMGHEPQPEMPLGGERLPIMRVVGQIRASYIITEGPEGMYLIDQHAAHERILFEDFMSVWGENEMPSQQLVAGLAVQLTPAQTTLVSDQLDVLTRLGFEIEPFGPNTFSLRAVPALLAKADPEVALRNIVDELEREITPMQQKIEDVVVKRVCKTAAVKAGQVMSQQEIEALVRQLEACETPHTCPHGRPTLIHLSVATLANQFGRT